MTPDEARGLWSAALEGELDEPSRKALEAALAADPALAAEYEAFARTLALARGADPDAEPPTPNLLPRVQRALRARSRGRFYADRFAERGGMARLLPFLLGATLLLLLALAFLALEGLGSVR